MKANKWVAVLAAGSMLAVAVPVLAQFGGLKSLKKAMDTVAKELEQPKPAPQATAAPAPAQAPAPQAVAPVAKPRDILKGQWVRVTDSCNPPRGIAQSATLTFYADVYEGEEFEGFQLFENSCTFTGTGFISRSSYSGKMSCGYGEGWEGDATVTIDVSENGTLQLRQEQSISSDGSEDRQETGWSDTFKRCPKTLKDPETW